MKRKAILIDIDGTLSNCSHREHYLKLGKPENQKFFDNHNIEKDSLNEWCKTIIEQFRNNYSIILLTGRQEILKNTTEKWLEKFKVHYDLLIMKNNDDFSRELDYKEKVFCNIINPEFEVIFAIDDNAIVVQMWRNFGITCLQCANNEF